MSDHVDRGTNISYLDPDDLVAIYNLSRARIMQMLRKGEIRGVKLGKQWRIHPDALAEVDPMMQKDGEPGTWGLQRGTVSILHRDGLRRLRRILGVTEPPKQAGPEPASGLTAEQIVEMRELRAQGWEYKPLAQKFGITPQHAQAICTGRYRPDAGGPLAKLRDCQSYEEIAPRVKALHEQGLSQRTIGQELGITQARVCAILNGRKY